MVVGRETLDAGREEACLSSRVSRPSASRHEVSRAVAIRVTRAAPKGIARVPALARNHFSHRLAALRAHRRSLRDNLRVARLKARPAQAFREAAFFAKRRRNAFHLPVQQFASLINRYQNRIRRDNRIIRFKERRKTATHRENVFAVVMA